MPFRGIQTKLRNDPLGPGGLGQLADNLRWMRNIAKAEHLIGTGEHNAWQVPRRLVTINAAGNTISPTTSDVVSVSSPSTGRYILTLANGRFPADVRPQLNVNSDQGRTKPCLIGYQWLTPVTLEVYINQLSSALGAGNTWAAAGAQFDIALHCEPLPVGAYAADALGHARGDTLTEIATDWDATVQAHGDIYAMLTAAHSIAGAHAVYEVASTWARVNYKPSGTLYEMPEGTPGVTLNRVSAGIVEVSYPTLKAPQAAFVCPDYQRAYATGSAGDLYVMQAERNSTTKHTVYLYKYDGTNWSVDDSDFFIVVHGS